MTRNENPDTRSGLSSAGERDDCRLNDVSENDNTFPGTRSIDPQPISLRDEAIVEMAKAKIPFLKASGVSQSMAEESAVDAAREMLDNEDHPHLQPGTELRAPHNLFEQKQPETLDVYKTMPAVLADFADVRSRIAGHDPTTYAYSLIAAASSAAPHSLRVMLGQGWDEPLVQWVAIVGSTGSGKTPAQVAAVEPISKMHADDEARWKREAQAAKEAKPPEEPPARTGRYFTDATIDAIIDRAANNDHAVLRHADEGTSWLNAMGRYSNGADTGERGTWLSGWNGRMYTVSRIGRGDKTLACWSVSILYGITPEKLNDAYAEASSDGMLARTLVCLADSSRWVAREEDPRAAAVTSNYAAAILAMTRQSGPITLSPKAAALWQERNAEYREVGRLMAEMSPGIAGFLHKAGTMLGRLAGLYAALEGSNVVSLGTMERACAFMMHATMSANIAHDHVFGVSQPVEVARRMATRILTNGKPRVERSVFGKVDAFRKADERTQRAAISYLAATGWLVGADTKRVRTGPGFSDATAWNVNPLVFSRFAGVAEKARKSAEEALSRFGVLVGGKA